MKLKRQLLKVGADGHYRSGSEVIRTDIDLGPHGTYRVVVEHLRSQNCVVIDLVHPDDNRTRVDNLYYSEAIMENENEQLVDWIEVYKDAEGQWRWRAKSNNGDILADSGEGYTSRVFTENMASKMFSEVPIRYESSAL